MTRSARSWLTVGVVFLAAGLFLWSIVYLGERFDGPRTVPDRYTPTNSPGQK